MVEVTELVVRVLRVAGVAVALAPGSRQDY
jgi:hypothetical protein